MKVGSLFSGAGCGDLGLEWAGFEHAWFCEADPYARKVLAARWPGVPIYGDIKEVDFTKAPSIELLAGGFPCQDISVAGSGEGIQGERSGLWSEFARAIAEIRPRYALIENSPALTGRGLDVVLSDLAALRYDAEWHCIPAAALGALHKRDRIWIVAYPNSAWEQQPQGTQRQGRRRIGNSSQAQALGNASGNGRDARRDDHGEHDRTVIASDGQHPKEVAHTNLSRFQKLDLAALAAGPGQHTGCSLERGGETWWATEPELGRVVDGTPNRVDRLRCIGNGQVPHCTYFIGRLIQEHSRQTFSKSVGNK
ncbi:MAG: DNA (cytosine-5-)-methyltransferase [Pseudodesulfovibrio sp.]|nr:DNA (cytosine-5-)-methyltransferase [Pseudodesulfovibrio sp.]